MDLSQIIPQVVFAAGTYTFGGNVAAGGSVTTANGGVTGFVWANNGVVYIGSLTNNDVVFQLNNSDVGRWRVNGGYEELYIGDYFKVTGDLGPLQVRAVNRNGTIRSMVADNGGFQAVFAGDRRRGTFDNPEAVVAGDNLVSWIGTGHDGVGGYHGCRYDMVAAETWSGTAHGSIGVFWSIAAGTTTEVIDFRHGGGRFFVTTLASAPADAALRTGEASIYQDETTKALKIKGKDSGGTVRTATVPWSGPPKRAFLWMYDAIFSSGEWDSGSNPAFNASLQPFGVYWLTVSGNGTSFTLGMHLAAGTYTMKTLGIGSAYSGIIDWTIDGEPVATQDWYTSVNPSWNVEKTDTVTIATDGWHSLRATVNGKNASSNAYNVFLTNVRFYQAAD